MKYLVGLLGIGLAGILFLSAKSAAQSMAKNIAPAVKRKVASEPAKIEFEKTIEIPGSEQFEKTRVGGLSGMVWDSSASVLWAVSDDRGRINEPRIYGFEFKFKPKEKSKAIDVDIKLTKMISLVDPKADAKKKKMILDLEGLSLLPWGNFLVVNEGDMNQKPRAQTRLMEFKTNGHYVRDYDLPEDYLAQSAGKQSRGPRNNFAFEGLSAALDRSAWVLASELGLMQDKGTTTRLLEFNQTEAWVLKPGREWVYPLGSANEKVNVTQMNALSVAMSLATSNADLPVDQKTKSTGTVGTGTLADKTRERLPLDTGEKEDAPLLTGVSDLVHVRGDEWWVLERGVALTMQGMKFYSDVYSVDLASSQEITKQKIFSTKDLEAKLNRNFEGIAWGPDLPDGRKLLILVSDNNLETREPTTFLLLGVTLPAIPKTDEPAETVKGVGP